MQPIVITDTSTFTFIDHSREINVKVTIPCSVLRVGENLPVSFTIHTESISDVVKLTAKIEASLFIDEKIIETATICEMEYNTDSCDCNCLEQLLELVIPNRTNPTVEGKLFSLTYSVCYAFYISISLLTTFLG